jgi:CubicO group peptidase (beta-lactamase class C family)
VPEPLTDQITALLEVGLTGSPRPTFPGAVCGVDDGERTVLVSRGWAYRYADAEGSLLPERSRRPITDDTVFDLASLTKLFTATAVMQLVESGALGLDDRLARYLDSYASPERAEVTVRHLLTHTSGLPADIHFWRDAPDPQARRAAVLRQPLEAPPGTRCCYSCVGYLTLGFLCELLGQPLGIGVKDGICVPLGLTRTGFRPLAREDAAGEDATREDAAEGNDEGDRRDSIAATEMRRISWTPLHDPDDPDPRGVVHDENAASLGGEAGNAGLFGSARDLLAFGRAVLEGLGGEQPSRLGLGGSALREMVSPQLPGGWAPAYQSGLGYRIDDRAFMGGLAGTGRAYGHTGFTGTSLVIDEARNLVCVLLTNRVHPSRSWSELNPLRRRLADLLAGHYPARED